MSTINSAATTPIPVASGRYVLRPGTNSAATGIGTDVSRASVSPWKATAPSESSDMNR